jgi:hypothetical protein
MTRSIFLRVSIYVAQRTRRQKNFGLAREKYAPARSERSVDEAQSAVALAAGPALWCPPFDSPASIGRLPINGTARTLGRCGPADRNRIARGKCFVQRFVESFIEPAPILERTLFSFANRNRHQLSAQWVQTIRTHWKCERFGLVSTPCDAEQ